MKIIATILLAVFLTGCAGNTPPAELGDTVTVEIEGLPPKVGDNFYYGEKWWEVICVADHTTRKYGVFGFYKTVRHVKLKQK